MTPALMLLIEMINEWTIISLKWLDQIECLGVNQSVATGKKRKTLRLYDSNFLKGEASWCKVIAFWAKSTAIEREIKAMIHIPGMNEVSKK